MTGPTTEAGKRLLERLGWFASEKADALLAGILAIESEARQPTAPSRDAERAALAAGTHEPAVDDFGNQYLAALAAPRSEPLDVERLARAMEDVFPGWLDEAPGTAEAQAEMRSYARQLGEAYEFLRHSASAALAAPRPEPLDVERLTAALASLGRQAGRYAGPRARAELIVEADAAIRAALAPSERPMGELTCQRCRRPNVWSWHAPSPLWNAVMRDRATGRDDYEVVCPPCFAELAEAKLALDQAWVWHFAPEGVDIASLWTPTDGRVWDAEQCLWVEPAALAAALAPSEPT